MGKASLSVVALVLMGVAAVSAWTGPKPSAAAGMVPRSAVASTPPRVRITERDGRTRIAWLIAQGTDMKAKTSADWQFQTPTGQVLLRPQSLIHISQIRQEPTGEQSSALFTFRKGPPRRLSFGRAGDGIVVQNPDETYEVINLSKIYALELL